MLIILGFILTPKYGALGMALATAISLNIAAFSAMAQLIMLHKLHPFGPGYYRAIIAGGLASIVLLSLMLLPEALPLYSTLALAVVLCITSVIVLLKSGLSPIDRVSRKVLKKGK